MNTTNIKTTIMTIKTDLIIGIKARIQDLIDIRIVRKMIENIHLKIETRIRRNMILKTRIPRSIGTMLKSKLPTII